MFNTFKYTFTIRIALLMGALSVTAPLKAQESVLSTGQWYKFSVEKRGVYKISYDLLRKAGVNTASIDPRKIKLYSNAGGMLPQSNSAPRPSDLTELAIEVKGESDGVFNSQDFILFYCDGPDHIQFDTDRDIFSYESNLYADKNFVFLTIGNTNGKRIGHRENTPGSFPLISTFDDVVYYENDQYNLLKSGREWYGEKFDITTEHTFKWDVPGIVPNSTIKLVSDVVAQSLGGSSFKVFVNNNLVGEQYVLPISSGQYTTRAYHQRDTLEINSDLVSAATQPVVEIKYQYVKSPAGLSIGYLDYVMLNVKRKLALYGDQTCFSSLASLQQAISTFELATNTTDLTLWDVSSADTPVSQQHSNTAGTLTFSTATETLLSFVVFNNKVPQPSFEGIVPNQNLHSLTTPDLLIVTHPDFVQEATRLAQHRQQHNGWSVAVVTTNEVYHEFSSGRQDVTAIRDLAKYLYDKGEGKLKSLLLFGRSSYDYKDRVFNNTNFVPTYESRNSVHALLTYSSDDYFGFLEDGEGTWNESPAQYHSLDIGVGRLPVKTEEEARHVVDKIMYYDTHAENFGRWRNRVVFVADDGDANEHQRQADLLTQSIESTHVEYDVRKIYLDAYPQILRPNGETSPDVNKKLLESIDQGALIINYTGHGAEKLWAHERIFDDFVIQTLANKHYPLFVTATCEFGRQDDPAQISSAEICVMKKDGGAIGMVSTARPVSSSTNFELNQAFYNAVFDREGSQSLTLGEIFRRTKNNSVSGVSNRNFSLIGDPSMTLAFPHYKIQLLSVTSEHTSDTLKAQSHVTFRGEVVDETMTRVENFNGILQAVLYDKESAITTLGNENPPFNFKQWDNTLFRGKAKVINGQFEFDFVVPKTIAYQTGKGKLNLYAYDPDHFTDAAGSSVDFIVGKSENASVVDINPPTIQAFMGDTTFINGGLINPTTTLVVRLSDESGINISGYGIGNTIMAVLDNDEAVYELSGYYESDLDDFTKGWIHFPIKDLTPGPHTITVKAWDAFNNPAKTTVDFIVTDSENLTIERLGSYPNPFSDKTMVFFAHNRSGDDLEAVLTLSDVTGNTIITKTVTIYSSDYRVNLAEIDVQNDFGEKLKAGLYLARLHVRSLTNGSKNERVTKLILLN